MKKFLSALLLVSLAASMNAQTVSSSRSKRAANPNQVVGEAMKTTGTVSLAVGVPCLAAGMACLMYANFVPNPMANYTTNQTRANADNRLQYISLDEYRTKAEAFTASTHAAEVAGYILTPMGGALTVVGIPLYIKGSKMTISVNYTGNGAGLALNF
mgnify:FL=1